MIKETDSFKDINTVENEYVTDIIVLVKVIILLLVLFVIFESIVLYYISRTEEIRHSPIFEHIFENDAFDDNFDYSSSDSDSGYLSDSN